MKKFLQLIISVVVCCLMLLAVHDILVREPGVISEWVVVAAGSLWFLLLACRHASCRQPGPTP